MGFIEKRRRALPDSNRGITFLQTVVWFPPRFFGVRDLGKSKTAADTILLHNFPQDLREVVDAWDTLPDAIKAAVLTLVAASKPVSVGGCIIKPIEHWPRRLGGQPQTNFDDKGL